MKIVPITIREANAFVTEKHRHHKGKALWGVKFAIGLGIIKVHLSVAICGRPSRFLDNGLAGSKLTDYALMVL